METVNKKIVVIAILMALFTTFLVYYYIKGATTGPQEKVEKFSVYVAAMTLPAKHKIVEGDLREEKVTRNYINSKAVQNKEEIIGRLTRDTIIEGEQILVDRLVSDDKTSLVYSVPEGKRAVSININEQISIGNMVRPGDYVDIVASFEKEEVEDANTRTIYPRMTKTVLENVLVLAVAQEQTIVDNKVPETPKTVTLALTPQDTERVVYITEYASVRMTLRSIGDVNNINSKGITRTDITTDKDSTVVPYSREQQSGLSSTSGLTSSSSVTSSSSSTSSSTKKRR